MTKQPKRESNLTFRTVTCAYCSHQREYVMIITEVPFEGVEHIWCPKCSRTYKYDRGTGSASILENITMKQGELWK
jgi:hypothetical protein